MTSQIPEERATGENPFFVLELSTDASDKEIVRQKQKLLGMLDLGLKAAARYSTPNGERARSGDSIRRAAAILEKPEDRVLWELWASGVCRREDDDQSGGHELRRALELHGELQRRARANGIVSSQDFDELGLAWDHVLDSGTLDEYLWQRSEDLDLADPGQISERFFAQVREQLVALIASVPPFSLDDLESPLAQDICSLFCEQAVERLELSCEHLIGSDLKKLGKLDASWRALRDQYTQLTRGRGSYVRNQAFYPVYYPLSHFAVGVHEHGHHALAESLFLWMRNEARALGDEEADTLQTENARLASDAQLQTVASESVDFGGSDHQGSEGSQYRRETSMGGSWLTSFVVIVIAGALLRLCTRAHIPRDDLDLRRDIHIEIPKIDMKDVRFQLEPTGGPPFDREAGTQGTEPEDGSREPGLSSERESE